VEWGGGTTGVWRLLKESSGSKLIVFAPLAVSGGLLMLLRPEWAGPLRKDSTWAHKTALFLVVGFMAVWSGIDFFG